MSKTQRVAEISRLLLKYRNAGDAKAEDLRTNDADTNLTNGM